MTDRRQAGSGLMRRGGRSPSGPQGTAWFVDSVSGDDGNDGLTPDTAFQTLSALSAVEAGDAVYLVTGSHWREELQGLPAPVTVRAYGTGDRPIVDGSDIIANASWTKTVGQTNVYEYDLDTNYDAAGGKTAHRAFEDGARLRRVTDLATCDATAGSFYAPTPTGGTDTIYVHATDSSDVTANGMVYELTARKWAIQLYTSRNHAAVVGVETRNNAHADGSLCVDGIARDCIARNGRIHNAFILGIGEDIDAIGIEPATTIGGSTMFVSHFAEVSRPEFAGRNTIYRRCRALADLGPLSPLGNQNTSVTIGFYVHTTQTMGTSFGTMQYEDCYAENCLTAFGAAQVTRGVYYRCGCGGTTRFGLGGTYAQNELVALGGTWKLTGSNPEWISFPADFEVPDTIIVHGCKVYRASSGTGPFDVKIDGTLITVERCTIVDEASQINWLRDGTFTWKRNVHVSNNPVYVRWGDGALGLPPLTIDQNVYYTPVWVDGWQAYNGAALETDHDLADWQTRTGQEANSLAGVDPELADPANGDFTIGSAAVLALGAGAEPDEEDDAELQAYWDLYRVG